VTATTSLYRVHSVRSYYMSSMGGMSGPRITPDFRAGTESRSLVRPSPKRTWPAVLLALATSCLLLARISTGQRKGATVVEVATAEALQEAFAYDAEHVHITNHLDLTTLPFSDIFFGIGEGNLHFFLYAHLKSLTVRPCLW
jgi:hypothetical protein